MLPHPRMLFARDAQPSPAKAPASCDHALELKLVDAGIAKDNFARADDARFYQGLAYYMAGETAKAQSIWRHVKGTDGSGELARLWQVQSRSAKK